MYYICSYYHWIFTRNVRILDIFVQLSSSSNRCGCLSEPNDKHSNSKDSRFRVSITKRPSDLLGQLTNTHTHP